MRVLTIQRSSCSSFVFHLRSTAGGVVDRVGGGDVGALQLRGAGHAEADGEPQGQHAVGHRDRSVGSSGGRDVTAARHAGRARRRHEGRDGEEGETGGGVLQG